MLNKLQQLVMEEEGQGMTEYGLVLGFIAVAAVAALALLREEIVAMFNEVLATVQSRPTDPVDTTVSGG